MSVHVPTPPDEVLLEELREAHARQLPLLLLDYRHIPVRLGARVLSVIGLTGDNVPVGIALGNVDDDEPDEFLVAGDARDPALAVRAGEWLADRLDPMLADHLAGEEPMQLLVDSPRTIEFLRGWSTRLRDPWLPGPYIGHPGLTASAERARNAYSLLRGVLAAAEVPGADIVTAAVPALNEHLTFPLAGAAEAQQLPVLMACARRAGIPVSMLPPMNGVLTRDIEDAEEITVSSATQPRWDNRRLVPALSLYKRMRNEAAGRDALRRVDPTVLRAASAGSGLDATVRIALVVRHRFIAEAFRILRDLPELPGVAARAQRADGDVRYALRRGLTHEMGWTDFPNVSIAGRDAERDARLKAEAVIDAVRHDSRAWAFAAARREAVMVRVAGPPSSDGRTVPVTLPAGTALRQPGGWWWLDDSGGPISGTLTPTAAAGGRTGRVRGTWSIGPGVRRVAAGGLGAPGTELRLVCLERPFDGRRWRAPKTAPIVAV